MRFGFNADAQSLQTKGRALSADLRCNIARTGLIWNDANEAPKQAVDRLKVDLDARGIQLLIVLYGVEPYIDPVAYGTAAQTYAARYPGAWLQVLNEPNSPTYGSVSPENARDCLSATWAHAGAKILGPSPAPIAGWRDYLRRAYAGTYAPVAIHLYPRAQDPLPVVVSAYAEAKAINREVYVTEMGLGRDAYGARQGELSVAAYKRLRDLDAAGVIFHTLYENPALATTWERDNRLWFVRADETRTGLAEKMLEVRS